MSETRHEFEPIPARDFYVRSACVCGWHSSSLDGTTHGAEQAWYAHMYSKGYRTREAIQAAAA